MLLETVMGSSYLLKSEALTSLIWNRYLTRLSGGCVTSWSCRIVRWGWSGRRSWRDWPSCRPWVKPVVLLHIVLLVVQQPQRVQQFFIQRRDILSSGLDVLYRPASTGASSAISNLFKCMDWYNSNPASNHPLMRSTPFAPPTPRDAAPGFDLSLKA